MGEPKRNYEMTDKISHIDFEYINKMVEFYEYTNSQVELHKFSHAEINLSPYLYNIYIQKLRGNEAKNI